MDGSDYPPKRPRRPPTPHEPTQQQRDMVRVLIANGVPHDIIAEVLSISPPTFKKHYRVECRTGFERIKALIGTAVVRSAMNGNVGAQKYWLGTHGGPEWRVPRELQGDLTDPMQGTATIVIHGGIPDMSYANDAEGEEDDDGETMTSTGR
jgi:hypothetical protein